MNTQQPNPSQQTSSTHDVNYDCPADCHGQGCQFCFSGGIVVSQPSQQPSEVEELRKKYGVLRQALATEVAVIFSGEGLSNEQYERLMNARSEPLDVMLAHINQHLATEVEKAELAIAEAACTFIPSQEDRSEFMVKFYQHQERNKLKGDK